MENAGSELDRRFDQAVVYALAVHDGHMRKETQIPYAAHLMSVCALVLEAGGTEDQAIAALLHDAVEDRGGEPRLRDIEHRFGRPVADIVEACSDSMTEGEKDPWKERKRQYIAHLRDAPSDALLVSLADKLHNLRSILADQRDLGDKLFTRFAAGKDSATEGRKQTEWYYRKLVKAFAKRSDDLTPGGRRLLDELRRTLKAVQRQPKVSRG